MNRIVWRKTMTLIDPFNTKEDFVFISYSHKDKAMVDVDVDKLIKENVRVWYDDGLSYQMNNGNLV